VNTLTCPALNQVPNSASGDTRRKLLFAGLALSVLFVLGGCARDHVTGRPSLSVINEEQEVELGKEYDAQTVAEYGLYDDEDLASLVDDIGQRLAALSHRSGIEYHFRVLDDGTVNAFALPGGFVYLPRGILAFFNSEDQLAGVMAHETAHVVARHGVEQMSQRVFATGFGLTDRLGQIFPVVVGLAMAPINLGMLKYSRDHENEADALGVEYATRDGYDTHAMADFFKTLGAMSEQAGHSVPTYLSTHPDSGTRYERVNELTEEWQNKIDYEPRSNDPASYLQRIDGIVYGRDPRLGFTADGMFYHPLLQFQLPIPADWKLNNSASRVIVVAPDENGLVLMALAEGESASEAGEAFLASEQVILVDRREQTVNGLPVVVIESAYSEGKQRLQLLSHFVEHRSMVLAFHAMASEQDFAANAGDFGELLGGVAPLTDKGILATEPRRVRVVRAPTAGQLESVLSELGVAEDDVQWIANLNGRGLQDQVRQGDWLKVVR
jgi:predicted Zn-dependent protease